MEVRYANPSASELYHFGVKGQKWGIRNYQNPDGSLTDAGRKHYNRSYAHGVKVLKRKQSKMNKNSLKRDKYQLKSDKAFEKSYRVVSDERSDKFQKKGYKFKRKASKLQYKTSKINKSGEKYYKKMEKKFNEIPVSTFNESDVAYVKKYSSKVLSKYSS